LSPRGEERNISSISSSSAQHGVQGRGFAFELWKATRLGLTTGLKANFEAGFGSSCPGSDFSSSILGVGKCALLLREDLVRSAHDTIERPREPSLVRQGRISTLLSIKSPGGELRLCGVGLSCRERYEKVKRKKRALFLLLLLSASGNGGTGKGRSIPVSRRIGVGTLLSKARDRVSALRI